MVELRGLLKIKYAMERGIVDDWNDMERIWQARGRGGKTRGGRLRAAFIAGGGRA